MKAKQVLIVLLYILAIASAPGGGAHAQATTPDPYKIADRKNARPRTDGTFVTWYTYSTYPTDPPGGDVVAYDMERRQRIQVAATPADERNPDVDAGTVVWAEGIVQPEIYPFTIRARNLRTNHTVEVGSVAATPNAPQPAIAGDMVVWVDPTGAHTRVMGRNIRTMAAPQVLAELPADDTAFNLLIAGNYVAWQAYGRQGARIMLYNLETGATQDVTPNRPGQPLAGGWYRCDLQPDLLACRNGEYEVVMRSLRDGSTTLLRAPENSFFGNPAIAGRYLIIQGRGGTPDSTIPNTFETVLFVYDRTTESLARTPIAYDESSTPIQDMDARGTTATWLTRQGPNPSSDITVSAAPLRDLLPTGRYANRSTQENGVTYFPETGHNLGGLFKAFWERSGGLAVFGYPLTETLLERNPETGQVYTVQYFERQRFEHHPEHAGTPYEVQLGLLGVNILRAQGRDWETFPKASPTLPHYVPETGHATATEFWPYWQSHGLEFGDAGITNREALALFGHPISEPALETNSSGDRVLTQWFERGRFEHHPGNPVEHRVLLGRLGAELLTQRGW